ncbi:hypothetical protein [Bacteroides sp.]|uniref:hypothetical protein n=1 Tax=Bacteroides sp. TaxID=29523 RepID=UPI002623AC5E|nr:hypothetical protein [Bacteroides sp.]MDD3037373.1 hypothetical protein [Bacteroides sp.]
MRIIILTLLLFFSCISNIAAQNDYLVSTSANQELPTSDEKQFIKQNFPLQLICKWTPGVKFMFNPSGRDQFLPILSSCDSEKEVDSKILRHKILTFVGTEEKSQELSFGTNYSTRFLFDCEGKKYYYEFKNIRIDEICDKNPRACINGLVYLQDVDTAKDLLVGRKIYIQSESVRIDDANNYSGFQDVTIPANLEATITAVGVGNQVYPVKIIFKDNQGHSYYLELALSRTNSGMDLNNFQAEKKMKYFSNAISFTNKNLNNIEALKNKYIGLTIYPRKMLEAQRITSFENSPMKSRIQIPRYTILNIKDIATSSAPNTLAILSVNDENGAIYQIEVDLKYDIIIKNENYIEDIFGFGDIRQKYSGITNERWAIISRGELEEGMNAEECRLSIGNPVEIRFKKDTRFETWFYNSMTLEFENGTLQRFK